MTVILVTSLCWWQSLFDADIRHQHICTNLFLRSTRSLSKNNGSEVLFKTGMGWSGIGTFKNLQIGSHPSFTFHIRRRSFGTFFVTWAFCELKYRVHRVHPMCNTPSWGPQLPKKVLHIGDIGDIGCTRCSSNLELTYRYLSFMKFESISAVVAKWCFQSFCFSAGTPSSPRSHMSTK